ncbi:ubiquinone-dependent pyruvate dehydrogenase [Photobacterium angustum]|uniref:Ubiquinone-dependent pyruvate dehydrogenase n=1 Tax=Photobacterium angustum TaxID=661 RepID=A0A855SEP3_PHOAN|nr:ubiquinone-dependent pyruvate dehydrogenase [Photobacterium angustum]KJG29782.1 pyruvate dehydrogenase [Photobacterium angustum]KJG43091.1 pyruvate dehydrogenase [Photobacterium angustum]KJG49384.1 pyruvate dehydrogenase [Photobacterium angustum]PSW88761.1 ubiquinone-dependent pyruvate dehydrogenase [Photobacterium angustum]PSX07995.1 ubiquinone-dependent pyruvate dehydrogenase [Photobacterium angustum]
MKQTIARYITRFLSQAGVERIWGVTGDSLNGISDSIRAEGKIRWMGTRHEEVAAFAAGAEAELTGKLAVCAGSCGPGNMHLINGLYNCYRNRVPVLAIASDIPSSEVGSHYFQETDPKAMYKECSVFCETLTHPEQMPQLLETAMRQAILKQGVSVIVLPGDIALQNMPSNADLKRWQQPLLPVIAPEATLVTAAAVLLQHSAKCVIMAGAGCKFAHDEVVTLAKTLKAPIVHALRGKEYLEHHNPYDIGMTGLIGFSSGYHALEQADTVILLGTGFPFRAFYPAKAKIIQIDIDPASIGRHTQVDLGIVADVKVFVEQLLVQLTEKTDEDFLNTCLAHYKKTRKDFDVLTHVKQGKTLIHPQTLNKLISEKAAEDAIFTCDVGTPTLWAARYLQLNGQRRLIGSFSHGSMANAMAQAIGIQAAAPERQVIAMCGDGGFSMLMGDLLTLIPYKLPLKIVVLNNSSLGFVAMEMKAAGLLSDSTDLVNPSFAAIAEACGIAGIKVDDVTKLPEAIDGLLATEGPALLEVISNKDELMMPPTIELKQAAGFGLYMLKAMFNKHGNQLIDVVKSDALRD